MKTQKKSSKSMMGACPSIRKPGGRVPKGDVTLPATKLTFTQAQLERLNLHLLAQEVDAEEESSREKRERDEVIDAVVERLVQRLVCGVGIIDHRFSCKFLASFDAVHHRRPGKHRRKYLVRLDKLSSPALYERPQPSIRVAEGGGGGGGGDGTPSGYAKMRVQGEGVDDWAEFISQGGFLRRDKIQERFVELLALSAAHSPDSPEDVDEALFCASPGKVVDVGVLQRILDIPADEQVFFGSASGERARFPDPRDFRIAIVESAPEVRLRVGCLSPRLGEDGDDDDGGGREVRLVLGVGCVGWPLASDYPGRVPLGHVDALLHLQAAQTGFYLVPDAPHPTVRCDDRASTWAIWMPAAELHLMTHYSMDSVLMRAMAAVEEAVKRVGRCDGFAREQRRLSRATSRHMLATVALFRLEALSAASLAGWAPGTLSRHLVEILDALGAMAGSRPQRSYFFPGLDVGVDEEGGVEAIGEYLRHLHEESLSPVPDAEDAITHSYLTAAKLEGLLLKKWDNVLKDLAPPPTTRSTRMGFLTSSTETGYNSAAAAQYSSRQLDYVGHLFREMLKVRQLMLQNQPSPWLQPHVVSDPREDAVEDLVYLLTAILDQAKDIALKTAGQHRGPKNTRRQRADSIARLKSQFDTATLYLVDSVRQDSDSQELDFSDDLVVVRHVLKWLYRALDEDRRNFGPVLRPYLNSLFTASHANGWHLEEFRKRQNLLKRNGHVSELAALGDFCKLVVDDKMAASDAILDAIPKRWLWARNMSEVAGFLRVRAAVCGLDIEGSVVEGLGLVFVSAEGLARSEMVALPVGGGVVCAGEARGRYATLGGRGGEGETRLATLKRAQTLGRTPAGVHGVVAHDDLVSRLHAAFYTRAGTPTPTLDAGRRRPTPTPHARLRDASPMTLALDAARRYGQHRGVGDVVAALVHLQKFSVLQEVASHLPDDQRTSTLDNIQKLAKETRRVSALRKLRQPPTPNPKPATKSPKQTAKIAPLQIYRSTNELSSIPVLTDAQKELIEAREKQLEAELRKLKEVSLLGTVRATRAQNTRPTVFGQESFFEQKAAPMGYRYHVDDGTKSLALRGQSSEGGRVSYRYGETGGTMSLGYKFGESEGRLYRYEQDDVGGVGLLEMTDDRQLRLTPAKFVADKRQGGVGRRKDVITKL